MHLVDKNIVRFSQLFYPHIPFWIYIRGVPLACWAHVKSTHRASDAGTVIGVFDTCRASVLQVLVSDMCLTWTRHSL